MRGGVEQPTDHLKGHKINKQIDLKGIKTKFSKFVGATEEMTACENDLSVTPTRLC